MLFKLTARFYLNLYVEMERFDKTGSCRSRVSMSDGHSGIFMD